MMIGERGVSYFGVMSPERARVDFQDTVFAWPYKGGEGSVLESDDSEAVWEVIGRAYRGED